jgi:hypothetical protein
VILVTAAIGAWLLRPGHPPSQAMAFNGVHLGDQIADLEKQWGPPDFKNARAKYQQWEHPLTQLRYDDGGFVIEVGGSGMGVLTRGDKVLLRCGTGREEDILPIFGPPPRGVADNFYRYPGLVIHCGSESQGVRNISNIQLVQNQVY